jgi:hypothetical protein
MRLLLVVSVLSVSYFFLFLESMVGATGLEPVTSAV